MEGQLRQVIDRFDLKENISEFLRCLECNNVLEPIDKEEIEARLPAKVKEWQQNFWYCKNCDKVYWKGTHYEKMIKFIKHLRNEL